MAIAAAIARVTPPSELESLSKLKSLFPRPAHVYLCLITPCLSVFPASLSLCLSVSMSLRLFVSLRLSVPSSLRLSVPVFLRFFVFLCPPLYDGVEMRKTERLPTVWFTAWFEASGGQTKLSSVGLKVLSNSVNITATAYTRSERNSDDQNKTIQCWSQSVHIL